MARPLNELKIGISYSSFSADDGQVIWGSGIIQNIFFLYQLLEACQAFAEVRLINFYKPEADSPSETLHYGGKTYHSEGSHYAAQHVDVMIEMGIQVHHDLGLAIKARGGKIVALRCGNSYADYVVASMVGKPEFAAPQVEYAAVWQLPMHDKLNQDLLHMHLRAPSRVVPYLWMPDFIQIAAAELEQNPSGLRFGYPASAPKNKIAICEPNLGPVKSFFTPFIAAELAYRQHPADVAHCYLFNTWLLRETNTIKNLVQSTDLYQAERCSYEGRYPIHYVLSHFADTIVSHHWENGLNYLYFDALYGNYPLIHNSEFLKDVGYYYPEFDAQTAAAQIHHARQNHAHNLEHHEKQNRALFHYYSIHHRRNQADYVEAISELFEI